jgi:hypothetical protein
LACGLKVPVTSTGRRGPTSTAALNFYDPPVARILILGGGCRGLRFAQELHHERHAVRIVTRSAARRSEIEAVGAECFIADLDRLVTLRPALEHITIACWMLATAGGEPDAIEVLHGSRLTQFLWSLIDTTVRGVVYEAGGSALPRELLSRGERIVSETTRRNAIPAHILRADPREQREWGTEAREAVQSLLNPRYPGSPNT